MNGTLDRQEIIIRQKEKRPHNSTYPKVVVQWLNQAQCFYQSLCLTETELLRNCHLRVSANRNARLLALQQLEAECKK